MQNFHKVNLRGSYVRDISHSYTRTKESWNTFSTAPESNENRAMPDEEDICGRTYLKK